MKIKTISRSNGRQDEGIHDAFTGIDFLVATAPDTFKAWVFDFDNRDARDVILFNLQHAKKGVLYRTSNDFFRKYAIMSFVRHSHLLPDPDGSDFTIEIYPKELREDMTEIANIQTYPTSLYDWYDFKDLPVTANLDIVLPETHALWIERISARVLHLTRRVSILRHEEPHLSSRSRRVCLDLDDRNEYVHRYDHSINLMRLPVGKLQLDINAYVQRWDAHEKKVAEAKEAGTEPPEFTRLSDRDTIEALLEKLEERLTEDALLDHHETHNTNEWRNAHADRKVVLCNADCSVGEVLLDINSFHTDREGNTNHQLAEQSFHDVAVKHWNQAKRTRFRELVTSRVITLPE